MRAKNHLTDQQVLRRLLGFLAPFKGSLLLSVASGLGTLAAGVGLMTTSAYLISAAALRPSIAALQVAIVGVRFFGLSRGVFRYLERLLSHSVNLSLLARLRTWIYVKVEPLSPSQTQDQHSGDLLARLVGDVDTLENFYVRVVSPVGIALIGGLGAAAFLGTFHPSLGFWLLAALAAVGVGLPILANRLSRTPARETIQLRGKIQAEWVDILQGSSDLIAFGQGEAALDRLRSLNREDERNQMRLAWIQGAQAGLVSLVTHLGVGGILLLAVHWAGRGEVSGVWVAAIVLASQASFEAVSGLPLAAQFLGSSLEAARRIFAIADLQALAAQAATPQTLGACSDLTLRGVGFAYPDCASQPALEDIDLELPHGRWVALVGPSGAGKTTLANLLLRFWDPSCGKIQLGGVDLRTARLDELRQRIGMISQRTVLFNQTVRQNLLLANPDATEDAMVSATRQAQIHERILCLPQGYDTWIGERGLRLSAGERQRIAIARVLLRNTPLLVLDEPTAGLDPQTEGDLLDTLYQAVFPGRSVLLITHRLIRLEQMDEILVLQHGRVVERGKQADLLGSNGIYRKMVAVQNRVFGE